MTDTSHRIYAVVIAAVVFFVSWAAVAAKPWVASKPDPRVAALALREQRLQADAKLVQQVVARRMAAYQVALKARNAQIAAARSRLAAVQQQSAPAAQPAPPSAPTVRVVNLPPLTVTRSS